ncbi:MAG: coenzyme F420-0:L-glutamate ligase [Dermatophilaceae bacterium]
MTDRPRIPHVEVIGVRGIPEVRRDDHLARLISAAAAAQGDALRAGDIVAVSSKLVSKALGLTAPSTDKEAVVASQTVEVVAERDIGGRVTRIVRSVAGPVMAAAGVDASNTGPEGDLLLLPTTADEVCRALVEELSVASGAGPLAVVLTDTAGRPWRGGQVDFALGSSGIAVYDDHRGGTDADGRPLAVTIRAIVDEIAAAADLVKGKVDRVPVAILRGLSAWVEPSPTGVGAESIVRGRAGDWFALGSQEAVRAALGVAPGSELAAAVGIRPVGSDTVSAQVDRAVGVALRGSAGSALSVGVDVGGRQIEVTGEDLMAVGAVAARLDVALHGEGVPHHLTLGSDHATITLDAVSP